MPIGAEVDSHVMAKGSDRKNVNLTQPCAPKARDHMRTFWEFHQGPQASACMTRPDIRLQPVTSLRHHIKSAWQTGGVHISCVKRDAISVSGVLLTLPYPQIIE